MSIKDKVILFAGSILAIGLAVSGILLAKGKMFAMSTDGFTANALLATASKDRFIGMGEMFRGMGEFAQSIPPILWALVVLIIAFGLVVAAIRFSFSISRVYEERNKYIVNPGTVVEKKLLGRGVHLRSLPFPVAGQSNSPDPDDGGLESDDPDKPEQEPFISREHAKQRVVSYV